MLVYWRYLCQIHDCIYMYVCKHGYKLSSISKCIEYMFFSSIPSVKDPNVSNINQTPLKWLLFCSPSHVKLRFIKKGLHPTINDNCQQLCWFTGGTYVRFMIVYMYVWSNTYLPHLCKYGYKPNSISKYIEYMFFSGKRSQGF